MSKKEKVPKAIKFVNKKQLQEYFATNWLLIGNRSAGRLKEGFIGWIVPEIHQSVKHCFKNIKHQKISKIWTLCLRVRLRVDIRCPDPLTIHKSGCSNFVHRNSHKWTILWALPRKTGVWSDKSKLGNLFETMKSMSYLSDKKGCISANCMVRMQSFFRSAIS